MKTFKITTRTIEVSGLGLADALGGKRQHLQHVIIARFKTMKAAYDALKDNDIVDIVEVDQPATK